MTSKDSDYYERIVSGLESILREVDASAVNRREEYFAVKRTRVYKFSVRISKLLHRLRGSIIGKVYRKLKKLYRHATAASPSHPSVSSNVHHLIEEAYGITLSPQRTNPIKVGIILRDGWVRPQSSAFLRLISPLTHSPAFDKIELSVYGEDISGDSIDQSTTNLFIVQRTAFTALSTAKTFYENARKHGAKIVVDLDDALTELDATHEQYSVQKESLDALRFIINECDELWCSTEDIAKYYRNDVKSIKIIPNSLDERIWDSLDTGKNLHLTLPHTNNKPLRLVYMGTRTHLGDFNSVLPALDRVYALLPGSFTLTVIGVSGGLAERPYLRRIRPPENSTIYPRFTKWFSDLHGTFDIGISPLEHSTFNEGKSDIKCIDYLAIGAIPLVENMAPYTKSDLSPYVLKAASIQEWTDILTKLIESEQFYTEQKKKADEAYEYILRNRSVTNVSELIINRISDVTD